MRSDAESPGPFVNTRYTCAGGLDTPGLAVAASYDNDINHRHDPHMNFRRRWSVASADQEDTTAAVMSPAAHTRKKPASPGRGGGGWSNCLFTFVADTAGKVWEYARSTGIVGFYAGEGKGYTLHTPPDDYAAPPTFRGHVRSSSSLDMSRTRVPGQYPLDEDEYAVRAPKRPLEDCGPDSWIMVPRIDEELRAASPGLSKRRPPKVNISRPTGPRRPLIPVRRTCSISSLSSPGLRPESAASVRRPDSAASVRRPDSAASVRRPDSAASFRRPDSAASNRTRPHSVGSAFTLSSPNTPHSPIPAEIQMLAAQRRREERQRNSSMRKINDRLKDMIREGREALGSRVEIEDAMDEDMEDEGFAEGCFDGREKW
ncbi:serine arginine repetitive matrix protein 1-like [Diplodia corticola]|uniref:Serine arginine repetitive matrix protein 1-like n=1 Tax=Diplodia corticola TaxID=236234 RepID=A0A1J9RMB3_9PEZI|nr:serine arginine repetitive matrix protein 1-like [Diplodia corticola]OJD28741.1 serine arginine repetitive matrix protein 1-like [Diplodia corticola]